MRGENRAVENVSARFGRFALRSAEGLSKLSARPDTSGAAPWRMGRAPKRASQLSIGAKPRAHPGKAQRCLNKNRKLLAYDLAIAIANFQLLVTKPRIGIGMANRDPPEPPSPSHPAPLLKLAS